MMRGVNADVGRWLHQVLAQWPGGLGAERREEYGSLVELVAGGGDADVWRQLPGWVRSVFRERGWDWNGIYALEGEETLRLFSAAGPPVCNTIERSGGVGSSGMCFDAILMNQTLVAADVKRWPGYHTCDAESGLRTVSGIVCPIRGSSGRPLAVWDLDATASIAPEDGPFMDRLLATLSSLLQPDAAAFAG